MNDLIIAIIGSGAFSAIVSALVTGITNSRRKSDSIRDGLKFLLYDKINYLAGTYIADGSIRKDDLKIICEMWEVYHNGLDGNGYLDAVMAQVKELPLKP